MTGRHRDSDRSLRRSFWFFIGVAAVALFVMIVALTVALANAGGS